MKRWLAAICAAVLFGMLWRVPAVCAAEEPEIPAAAYALMETETGTLLLESHSGDRLACGAMAKLMTAYLAAEQVEQGNWTADTVLTATDAVTGTKGAVDLAHRRGRDDGGRPAERADRGTPTMPLLCLPWLRAAMRSLLSWT